MSAARCKLFLQVTFISFLIFMTIFIATTKNSKLNKYQVYLTNLTLNSFHLDDDVVTPHQQTEKQKDSKPIKSILLYNDLPGGITNSLLGTGRDVFVRYRCDVTDCFLVNDRQKSKRSMSSYDAVVFNMNALHYSGKLPWNEADYWRNPKQRFVFMSMESPMLTWGGSGQNKT